MLTMSFCTSTEQGLERQQSSGIKLGSQPSCVAAALCRFTAEGGPTSHASPLHAPDMEAHLHNMKREVRLTCPSI